MRWLLLVGAVCLVLGASASAQQGQGGTSSVDLATLNGPSGLIEGPNLTVLNGQNLTLENITGSGNLVNETFENATELSSEASPDEDSNQEEIAVIILNKVAPLNNTLRIPGTSNAPPPGSDMARVEKADPPSVSKPDESAPDVKVNSNEADSNAGESLDVQFIEKTRERSPHLADGFPTTNMSTTDDNPDLSGVSSEPDPDDRDPYRPSQESIAPSEELPLVVIASGLTLLAAAGAASQRLTLSALGRYFLSFFWGGVGLFAHIGRDKALKHPHRQQLYDVVHANPGVCEGDLYQIVGLQRSSARYHLGVLEQNGYVHSYKVGKKRHFYLQTCSKKGKEHAILMHGAQRRVARFVLREPGINQKQLCERLSISASRAHERLTSLIQAGLIAKKQAGNTVRYYPTPRLEGFIDDLAVMTGTPA